MGGGGGRRYFSRWRFLSNKPHRSRSNKQTLRQGHIREKLPSRWRDLWPNYFLFFWNETLYTCHGRVFPHKHGHLKGWCTHRVKVCPYSMHRLWCTRVSLTSVTNCHAKCDVSLQNTMVIQELKKKTPLLHKKFVHSDIKKKKKRPAVDFTKLFLT